MPTLNVNVPQETLDNLESLHSEFGGFISKGDFIFLGVKQLSKEVILDYLSKLPKKPTKPKSSRRKNSWRKNRTSQRILLSYKS